MTPQVAVDCLQAGHPLLDHPRIGLLERHPLLGIQHVRATKICVHMSLAHERDKSDTLPSAVRLLVAVDQHFMEYAPFADVDMPKHQTFRKVGEMTCEKMAKNQKIVYMSVGGGRSFKFEEMKNVDANRFEKMYFATSKAGAAEVGKIIAVRRIGFRIVSIDPEITWVDGQLELKVTNPIAGAHLCIVNADPTTSLGELKKIISRTLVEMDLASESMPIMFSDSNLCGVNLNTMIKSKFNVPKLPQKVKKTIEKKKK